MFLLLVIFALAPSSFAQNKNFVGSFGGISTLSADGAFDLQGGTSAQSQYKPENGPTVMLFAGRHLHQYFSVQASYSWNHNRSTLSASEFGVTQSAYEQDRENSQHTVVAEGMLFFRNLDSRARPYLSAGAGFHRFRSTSKAERTIGSPVLPPAEFSETGAAFRVAVGIDLLLRRKLAFRYSFSETIQGNPLSKQLHPQPTRNLANFQNLFGLAWHF
ncbi:MAG: porin family protein [Acidobacteriales bacterium]|nr:porin family protein [Terriglobales bacterium]